MDSGDLSGAIQECISKGKEKPQVIFYPKQQIKRPLKEVAKNSQKFSSTSRHKRETEIGLIDLSFTIFLRDKYH